MDSISQELSSSQRLLLTLKKARAKIDRLERDPIAIVGLGCRFPGGANDIEQFWQLLHDGRDGVIDIPPSRWPASEYYDPVRGTPNKMYVKQGAFLQFPIEQFDPQFFGIAPLEAQHLDPRHRLLLEVTWEALENAGWPADQLPTETGIFVGIIDTNMNFNHGDTGVYAFMGTSASVAVGRLAYTLGVQGPNMAIDTTCSSSLVATHLACQSLRAGECEVALCGGVQLMLAPEPHLALSAVQALSPDGRCKTFAASADGYGRGEGCGMVVLKRLSAAIQDGDLIWGVIRSSAINHDGRSSGLTVPNKVAQTALIRNALAKAQVAGHEVSYVEAHGTGTKLGDPIEVRALVDALGERETPLWVGSVKTNIGHLEACAGIAGVIKVALALHHGEIPPHLHFDKPNPLIDWADLPIQVPVTLTPWPAGEQPRIAGISAFGLSGTNAHLILAEAPHPDSSHLESKLERPYHLLTLSGKTEQARSDQVTRYLDYLARHPELDLADVCYTANTGRVHFEHRLAVTAQNLSELQAKLRRGEGATGCYRAISPPHQVAFLFTGQGSQYVEMGRELYETHPLFRQLLEQCDAILRAYLDTPLLDLLYPPAQGPQTPDPGQRMLDQTRYTQPALFALEYALAKLWQSWGVVPDVVMGHSVGEYVAACVAGVFSLEDGLKLIAERGRLMQALPLEGRMVAVSLEERALTPLLQPYLDQVSIASFNAPQSLVLSGQTDRLEEIIRQLEEQGVTCKRLTVSHAFHSPLMTPMLAEFERVARSIGYSSPRLKLVSNVTGQVITEIQADYWVQHVREPVRFAQGLATVAKLGVKVFIEVGPKPTLLGLGPLSVVGSENLWLPSLYPQQQNDWRQLLESLGTWYVHGGRVDWRNFDQPYPHHKVSLPTYPFQRQRYWIDQHARTRTSGESKHPLVGPMIRLPNSAEVHFQTKLPTNQLAYLSDYRVFDQPLLPATTYLEMALAAGKELFKGALVRLTNLNFQQPLMCTAATITVQQVFTPLTEGYRWQFFSWEEEPQEWVLHSVGEIFGSSSEPEATYQLAELQSRCPTEILVQAHYQTCSDQGLDYGPEFQGIERLYQGEGEALGLIRLSESLQLEAGRYQLHPVLLEAGVQVGLGAMNSEPFSKFSDREAYLPVALERFQLHAAGRHQALWSYAKVRPQTDGSTPQVDIILLADTGQVVAELSGLMVRPASREALRGSQLRTEWLYQLAWQPATLPKHSPYTMVPGRWLIIGDHPLRQPLVDLLHAHGEQVVKTQMPGEKYRGVVYLGRMTLGEQEIPEAALTVSSEVLQLVQGLLQSPGQPRLWLVSQGQLATSVLWGLGRTLMWEHPELQCSCLDLNALSPAETLFETIWFADNENQITLRDTQRQVARLVRYQPQPASAQPLNNQDSYLITGGLGGLGLKVAAWLVEQGARNLVLSNRRGLEGEAAQRAISHLESLGAKVLVVKADVSQKADVAQLLAECQRFAPLRGIIHAAGVLSDGIWLQQTAAQFAKVFAPKVHGSWYLHQLSQEMPLSFFVCFSSVASFLGNGGQANYAAANAFMDALMSHRHALGLPALSINWGGWSEVGLAANLVGKNAITPAQCVDLLAPAQGVDLLGYLLSQPVTQVGVIPVRWASFGQQLPGGATFPIFTHFLKLTASESTQTAWWQQLASATASERYTLLKQYLHAKLQTVVGIEPTEEQSLLELGLDSLMSIQLATQVNRELQLNLAIRTFLEPTTLVELAEKINILLTNQLTPMETNQEDSQREVGEL